MEDKQIKNEEQIDNKFNLKKKTKIVVRKNGFTLDRVDKIAGKVLSKDVSPSTFEGFIRKWIFGKLGKKTILGHYQATAEKLFYHGTGRNVELGDDILAIRLKDGRIVGNASKLHRCGSYKRGDEAPAQRVMFDINLAMIPFNVFDEVSLDIRELDVLEQGSEEDFVLPKLQWSTVQASLVPVQIKFNDTKRKKPLSNSRRKILSCKRWNNKTCLYDKYSNPKKDEKGKQIFKDDWKYDFTYLNLTNLTKRHFVGAMLFRVAKKIFLFDVDRNELKQYRFNPFLSEIPAKVKTIKDAYLALKPKIVRNAERRGLKVLRQGEWFFIPAKLPSGIEKTNDRYDKAKSSLFSKRPKPSSFDLGCNGFLDYWGVDDILRSFGSERKVLRECRSDYSALLSKYRKNYKARCKDYFVAVKKFVKKLQKIESDAKKHVFYDWGAELRAGDNRPNTVSKLYEKNGKRYVKGSVEHTGREHEPIKLNTWHRAIPNTAIKSFTISGNID